MERDWDFSPSLNSDLFYWLKKNNLLNICLPLPLLLFTEKQTSLNSEAMSPFFRKTGVQTCSKSNFRTAEIDFLLSIILLPRNSFVRLMISQFGILFSLVKLMTSLFEFLLSQLRSLYHCYLDLKSYLKIIFNYWYFFIEMKCIYKHKGLRTTLNSVVLNIFPGNKEGEIELILTSIVWTLDHHYMTKCVERIMISFFRWGNRG